MNLVGLDVSTYGFISLLIGLLGGAVGSYGFEFMDNEGTRTYQFLGWLGTAVVILSMAYFIIDTYMRNR